MNTIANQIPSVWSMSSKDLQDHLTYISQQGLTRIGRDKDGHLSERVLRASLSDDPLATTLNYLIGALSRSIDNVQHHLGWIAKWTREVDGYDENTDAGLVEARVAMLAVWRYADEIRAITYTPPTSF